RATRLRSASSTGRATSTGALRGQWPGPAVAARPARRPSSQAWGPRLPDASRARHQQRRKRRGDAQGGTDSGFTEPVQPRTSTGNRKMTPAGEARTPWPEPLPRRRKTPAAIPSQRRGRVWGGGKIVLRKVVEEQRLAKNLD